MTPEQYTNERLLILENAMRNLMMTLCAAFPNMQLDIDTIGRGWDQALDRLDSERKAQEKS
jgi:hypothetical protein